ncbi:NDP-hexose 2,3-dehydratase family protein [Sphaerisporangium dianthi]|uniref:NDP-hexose 2,3-dehydratase family protein n=1 Tax=Sphaerisporangium dianthi TaxID=1436120 RepID=A0ABV9CNR8_9ACTN
MNDGFAAWWADRHRATRFEVRRIPFAKLDRWDFEPGSGNLAHESGSFFTVEGLRVRNDDRRSWSQPIINQPEIGILGVLVKDVDGEPHCLMQAKMEPGNVNTLQLSPTVQATRSNFTRVHRGGTTRHLEHFAGSGRGKVLVDSLQSEQGAWFWHKHNRNMVVEATAEVPEHEDFRWLPLHRLRRLMRRPNLVNMDARTVLACMRFTPPEDAADPFTGALVRSYRARSGLHTTAEVLSWLTEARTRCDWRTRLIPLGEVSGWSRTDDEILHDEGKSFRILAVEVEAGNREVTRWSQPLLAPRGKGLAAFLTRAVDGVLHLLVQTRLEPGLRDVVELAPTLQLSAGDDPGDRPYARELLAADRGRVRFDTVMSEEGGRFYHAQTRYLVVEADPGLPPEVPEDFRWVTVRQLMDLLRHGHYVNVEARSLIACLHSLW